jgi:hypothetical protein
MKTAVCWEISPPLEVTGVAEEHVAPIFRVEQEAKPETNIK